MGDFDVARVARAIWSIDTSNFNALSQEFLQRLDKGLEVPSSLRSGLQEQTETLSQKLYVLRYTLLGVKTQPLQPEDSQIYYTIEELKTMFQAEQQKATTLQKEINDCKINFQTQLQNLQRQYSIVTQQYSQEQSQGQQYKEQLACTSRQLEQLQAEYKDYKTQMNDKLQINQQLVNNLNQQLKTTSELHIQQNNQTRQRYQEEQYQLLNKVQEQRKQLNDLLEQNKSYSNEIRKMESEIEQCHQMQQGLRDQYKGSAAYYKQQFMEVSQQNNALQMQLGLEELRHRDRQLYESQISALEHQIRLFSEKCNALSESEQKNQQLIKELVEQRNSLEVELAKTQNNAANSSHSHADSKETISFFQSRIHEQNNDIQRFRTENQQLRKSLEELSDIVLERDEIIQELKMHVELLQGTRRQNMDIKIYR